MFAKEYKSVVFLHYNRLSNFWLCTDSITCIPALGEIEIFDIIHSDWFHEQIYNSNQIKKYHDK